MEQICKTEFMHTVATGETRPVSVIGSIMEPVTESRKCTLFRDGMDFYVMDTKGEAHRIDYTEAVEIMTSLLLKIDPVNTKGRP